MKLNPNINLDVKWDLEKGNIFEFTFTKEKGKNLDVDKDIWGNEYFRLILTEKEIFSLVQNLQKMISTRANNIRALDKNSLKKNLKVISNKKRE